MHRQKKSVLLPSSSVFRKGKEDKEDKGAREKYFRSSIQRTRERTERDRIEISFSTIYTTLLVEKSKYTNCSFFTEYYKAARIFELEKERVDESIIMGLFGGNNKNTDENAPPSGSKPPHGRRLSQSMINTETGKFMSKLINESSYLSGTGETNTFDTAEAVAESDELMREMFFSIVKETAGEEMLNKIMDVYKISETFSESHSSGDFDKLKNTLDASVEVGRNVDVILGVFELVKLAQHL